jgi:hypothetical protein
MEQRDLRVLRGLQVLLDFTEPAHLLSALGDLLLQMRRRENAAQPEGADAPESTAVARLA